ncbi:MAG: penicillin-binding protein 2 [Actinomycetota bacterium]
MNTQIRKLVAGLLALYVALFAALNVTQVVRKESLDADPKNNRQTIRDFNRPRGQIITADGVVVAESVPTLGDAQYKYQRQYPLGDLFSNITGYYTYSFGSTQLERTQTSVLMGDTGPQKLSGLLGSADNSGNVRLTLRADVQRVAADALGEQEGSVVVTDPSTGAVIAMVSYPRYDANAVATHDTTQAETVLNALNAAPGKPLLANAYQENYMPGSSFKILTASIAFENGVTALDRVFPDESSWTPPQTTDPITNYAGHTCGGTMTQVFFRSCNIAFARLSSELGPERMTTGVRAWGVGEKLPIDLPGAAASTFCGNVTPCDASFFKDQLPLLAIGGFGQGNDLMVPLHMCMIAATVANGGKMMKPYVVDATLNHHGGVLQRTNPAVWKSPIGAGTAATLTAMMIEVVNQGTGTKMQLDNGIQAAAKTGTAQLNAGDEPQRSHAWIVGFAPAAAPRYAVAVVLKGTNAEISAGTGGKLAGPIAKKVLDYLFTSEPT